MGHLSFTPDLDLWRFYEDGTEAGATAIAAEDTNVTRDPDTDPLIHLSVRVQETGGASGSNDDYQLEVSYNSGTFGSVTGSDIHVRPDTTSGLTEANATTDRLTAGSGSFLAGVQKENDALISGYNHTLDDYNNHVFALELQTINLLDGDTLDFRLLFNGATFAQTAPTPQITISKAVNSTLVADSVSYAWTGQVADFTVTMPAAAVSYAWTGQVADFTIAFNLVADAVAYDWAVADAGFLVDRVLAADVIANDWTGQTANLLLDSFITADTVSYSWTGQAADFFVDYSLTADIITYNWTGNTANLLINRIISAEAVSYLWTGQTADLLFSRVFAADSISYVWTGQPATLIGPGAGSTLAANTASYLWTGATANLLADRIITSDAASYLWTGAAANLLLDTFIIADSVAYSWTGGATSFLYDAVIAADPVSYLWNGTAANFSVVVPILAADAVSYIWTGQAADLLVPAGTAALAKDAFDLETTVFVQTFTPEQARFLVRNFTIIRDVLKEGVTADVVVGGTTLHVRHGIVIGVN